MLKAFSQSLEALYRLSHQVSPYPFRVEVLRLIGKLVSFDGAFFKFGSVVMRIDSNAVIEQPHDNLAIAAAIETSLLTMMGPSGGIPGGLMTKPLTFSDHVLLERLSRAALQQGAHGINAQSLLVFGNFRAHGSGPQWIVLYRRDKTDFSETECVLLQHFWNHIASAAAFNLTHVINADNRSNGERAMGVINSSGALENADAALILMIEEEWPEFDGSVLPALALNELLGTGRYRGQKIDLLVFAKHGYLLCEARHISVIDTLTPREKNVAHLFASGISYGEIARQLGVAPSTVRNQLAQIYQKLGIHSKIELAKLIAKI